jgi:hypothetical protein
MGSWSFQTFLIHLVKVSGIVHLIKGSLSTHLVCGLLLEALVNPHCLEEVAMTSEKAQAWVWGEHCQSYPELKPQIQPEMGWWGAVQDSKCFWFQEKAWCCLPKARVLVRAHMCWQLLRIWDMILSNSYNHFPKLCISCSTFRFTEVLPNRFVLWRHRASLALWVKLPLEDRHYLSSSLGHKQAGKEDSETGPGKGHRSKWH